MENRYSVLFVCSGNICLSPTAEFVFLDLAKQRGVADSFHAESRGIGNWHVGDGADPRTLDTALRRGVSLREHRAKQISKSDFKTFNLILAMDRTHYRDLEQFKHAGSAELVMFRNFDPKDTGLDVPDPYSGGPQGFEDVYDMVHRCCDFLLTQLIEEKADRGTPK